MAARKNELAASEVRRVAPTSPSGSSTMKLSQVLRRGSSATVAGETREEKEGGARRSSVPESQRRSSLPTLPLRLRRKKTTRSVAAELTEQDAEAAERLGRLFFSLPCEIVIQIIEHLDLQDIYTLRLTSRGFNDILNYNSVAVTREILPRHLAPVTVSHIQTHLYPADNHDALRASKAPIGSMGHLLRTRRRQHVVDRQIHNLLAFVQMKIYMTRTATRVLSVSENRQRLSHALQRPAWFLTHFLERYRDIVTRQHPRKHRHHHSLNDDALRTNSARCPDCIAAARAIVEAYPDADVVPTCHFYRLTLEHLRIATRAPSSTTAGARLFRSGKNRAHTTAAAAAARHADNLAVFVILGGVPQLRRVAMMQGTYESRTGAMLDFVDAVRRGATPTTTSTTINSNSYDDRDHDQNQNQNHDSGVDGDDDVDDDNDAVEGLTPIPQSWTDSLSWLPLDVDDFFTHIWHDRVQKCVFESSTDQVPNQNQNQNQRDAEAQETERERERERNAIASDPYAWLQSVMSGSGLDFFGESRGSAPSLGLGPPPV